MDLVLKELSTDFNGSRDDSLIFLAIVLVRQKGSVWLHAKQTAFR